MARADDGDGRGRSGRRQMLGWLAAAPGGLLLAQACGGAGSGGGDAAAGADAVNISDAASPGRDADVRMGLDGGSGADAAGADAAAAECEATGEDALGPFFQDGSPMRMRIADPNEPGERLLIEGRLQSVLGCRRLGDHVVDLWQADRDGNYYMAAATDYRLRGRVVTGADGGFAFETVMPGNYLAGGGLRPAHIHARVYAPGGAVLLTTQIYFAGDPYLGEADSCGPPTCFSGDPARVLDLEPARIGGVSGSRGALVMTVMAV